MLAGGWKVTLNDFPSTTRNKLYYVNINVPAQMSPSSRQQWAPVMGRSSTSARQLFNPFSVLDCHSDAKCCNPVIISGDSEPLSELGGSGGNVPLYMRRAEPEPGIRETERLETELRGERVKTFRNSRSQVMTSPVSCRVQICGGSLISLISRWFLFSIWL